MSGGRPSYFYENKLNVAIHEGNFEEAKRLVNTGYSCKSKGGKLFNNPILSVIAAAKEGYTFKHLAFTNWLIGRGVVPTVSELGFVFCRIKPSGTCSVMKPKTTGIRLDEAIKFAKAFLAAGTPIEYDLKNTIEQRGQDSGDGWSPLHKIIKIGEGFHQLGEGFHVLQFPKERIKVAEFLLEHGADINIRTLSGATPLLLAAKDGDVELFKYFLDKGADAEAETADGHGVLEVLLKDVEETEEIKDILVRHNSKRIGVWVSAEGTGFYQSTDSFIPGQLKNRTAQGLTVRSKSEVIIADCLFYLGVEFAYEAPFKDSDGDKVVLPDFTIYDKKRSKMVIWEHLGMMDRPDYRDKWKWKERFYNRNGFFKGKNLFITVEDGRIGIDSSVVRKIAGEIQLILSL